MVTRYSCNHQPEPHEVSADVWLQVIGTNHVLPTKGAANFTGGLWVGKYLKTVTYQEVTSNRSSAELGRLCGRAARAEKFEGHARSGDIRAKRFGGDRFEWISRL